MCIHSEIPLILALLVVPLEMTAATIGPTPDFIGFFDKPTKFTLTSVHKFTLTIPPFPSAMFLYESTQEVIVNIPTPFFVESYTTFEASGFNLQTSTFRLTEIAAVTVDLANGLVTGFDPLAPQVQPPSPVAFTGRSGTVYTADVNIVSTLANLNTLLPGFDLSSFIGDPNSIVYVSQATVPAVDGVIPEPASVILFSSGLLWLLCYSFRDRIVRRTHNRS